jgi:hypothetical protein
VGVDSGDRRLRLKRWIRNSAIVLIVIYVFAYTILSRRGMAQSRAAGHGGWYFFVPKAETETPYMMHLGCVIVFFPLILVDRAMGTAEMPQFHEPILSLQRGNVQK